MAAATAVVLLAGWVLWGTSLAGVRQVRVTGTWVLTEAEVRQAAAIPDRTPLLRLRPDRVAARVQKLAPVASAGVRRDWPDTVVIEVVERTAVAVVPDRDRFTVIDAGGVGFQTLPEAPGHLPVIVTEGGPDPAATAAALTVLAALTPRLRGGLAELVVQGPAGIRLVLDSGRMVVWGDPHDSPDKARVATALLDRDGEVIDVSALEVVSVR
jgi:cell division protein FtsQ